MAILFKLINKYFWKGYVGPIFAFIVPPIIVFFLGTIIGPTSIMPNALMIPIITISLIFIPQSIFEFKNSSLLKRIGSTPVNPIIFLSTILIYNFGVILLSFIFLFLISFAIFAIPSIDGNNYLYDRSSNNILIRGWMSIVKDINWLSFIYSIFLLIILSMSIGVTISSFARTTLFIQGIGITITLITFFIAPLALPMAMVSQFDVIKYISYFLPLKYPISLGVESFYGSQNIVTNIYNSSIWNISNVYEIINPFALSSDGKISTIIIYNKTDKILNQLLPYIFIIIFMFISINKFTWSNRSSKKINWRSLLKINDKTFDKNIYENDESSKYILEANNISKTFNNKGNKIVANNGISFKIQRLKNTAILGGNGSGKTTLVEMIIGLNNPDNGYFKYSYNFDKSYQYGIGIQFQDSSYPFGLKCRDIIQFVMGIYKIKMDDDELNSLIQKFGVTKFINKNASSLSGGQQQRLNLLLSLIHKPRILFLDELSTGLDIQIRNNIKKFIKEYCKENKITLIIISHDMNEVEYLCDDVIIINDGKLIEKTSIKKTKSISTSLDEYISKKIK